MVSFRLQIAIVDIISIYMYNRTKSHGVHSLPKWVWLFHQKSTWKGWFLQKSTWMGWFLKMWLEMNIVLLAYFRKKGYISQIPHFILASFRALTFPHHFFESEHYTRVHLSSHSTLKGVQPLQQGLIFGRLLNHGYWLWWCVNPLGPIYQTYSIFEIKIWNYA